MAKPYRTTKIVIPGWEQTEQRAYLVVDRETGEPLGRVSDMRLWNIYNPAGAHWRTAHSDPDIHDCCYETMSSAVQRLWREHEPVEPGRDFPPINLEHAQNFDYDGQD